MKLGPNQQKWIEALRSREFDQGEGSLQKGDRFCCLGVACVIASQNDIPIATDENGEIVGDTLEIQDSVQDWLKLRDPEGHSKEKVFGRHEVRALASLNDLGMSFLNLADVIEQNPEEFFVGTA